MKIRNITTCQTCESYDSLDSQKFKVTTFPRGIIPPPSKNADRLLFVLSGKLAIASDGQQEFICDKGHAVLLIRDVKYTINALREAKLLVLSFLTSYQVCDQMTMKDAKVVLGSIEYKFHAIEIRKPLRLLLESALNYLKDGILCSYWQKAKQLELFVVFWNYYTLEEICRFFYPLINKDIHFHSKLMANHRKAKTVTELAKLCGYGQFAFNKLFSQHFGDIKPYQWMLQQNAPLIKAKLFDINIPIKLIITEFGFIDHPHFNKYCKKYLGATALQIREGKEL